MAVFIAALLIGPELNCQAPTLGLACCNCRCTCRRLHLA
jgi:hypothetical protein